MRPNLLIKTWRKPTVAQLEAQVKQLEAQVRQLQGAIRAQQQQTFNVLHIPPYGEIREGDLRINVIQVINKGPFTARYQDELRPTNLSLVHIRIKNVSPDKVVEWPGWQGKGEIEDEHGHKLMPVSLNGWSWLPSNTPDGWDGDFAARIQPGATYENAVYFEPIPETSRQAIVTFPLTGRTVKFHGPIGSQKWWRGIH